MTRTVVSTNKKVASIHGKSYKQESRVHPWNIMHVGDDKVSTNIECYYDQAGTGSP